MVETLCFQESAWLRSRRFLFPQLIQRDKAKPVVLDMDVLYPLAVGSVLVNLDEQLFQLCNALLLAFQTLSADGDLLTALYTGLFFNDRAEMILMPQDVPHDRLNVFEGQPFQNLDADEMPIAFLLVLAV